MSANETDKAQELLIGSKQGDVHSLKSQLVKKKKIHLFNFRKPPGRFLRTDTKKELTICYLDFPEQKK